MKQIKINNEFTYYYITEDGRLYCEKTKRWYKGSDTGGYLKYDINWDGKRYCKLAHRLVAEAFIPQPDGCNVVNHKDGNKLNNTIDNLEWTTVSGNNFHAYEKGLKKKTNGSESRIKITQNMLNNENWKQYKDTNYYISDSGKVINRKTNNLLKGKITKDGYVEWCLNIKGKKHSYLAHRLIYEVFCGELKPGLTINHINGNKQDNRTSNLEQITYSKNMFHSFYSIGHKNIRPVGQYDLNGILLKKYPSCAEAARQNPGFFPNLISNVCNGKQNTHKGYKWKYLDQN